MGENQNYEEPEKSNEDAEVTARMWPGLNKPISLNTGRTYEKLGAAVTD